MKRPARHVFRVTTAGYDVTVLARTAGSACRRAFRAIARLTLNEFMPTIAFYYGDDRRAALKMAYGSGKVFTTPETDLDNGEGACFKGVSVSTEQLRVSRLPKPMKFSELCRAARLRAALS